LKNQLPISAWWPPLGRPTFLKPESVGRIFGYPLKRTPCACPRIRTRLACS